MCNKMGDIGGAGRQWHFFLDSRRTSYTTTHCYERIQDEPYPYSARISAVCRILKQTGNRLPLSFVVVLYDINAIDRVTVT